MKTAKARNSWSRVKTLMKTKLKNINLGSRIIDIGALQSAITAVWFSHSRDHKQNAGFWSVVSLPWTTGKDIWTVCERWLVKNALNCCTICCRNVQKAALSSQKTQTRNPGFSCSQTRVSGLAKWPGFPGARVFQNPGFNPYVQWGMGNYNITYLRLPSNHGGIWWVISELFWWVNTPNIVL